MMKAEVVESSTLTKNLPNGWRWIRLGDHVTKVGSGITPQGGHAAYVKTGIPLIRSQNVHMNQFALTGLVFITPEQDEEMRATRVMPGDVLLNITGASIGRVCVVPSEFCPANVNQHVSIIRSDGSFEPAFLSYYLSTPHFQKHIMDAQAGATRQALTKALIENFNVPLPALEEQLRIAAILNEQMAAINKTREAVETQIGLTTSLIDSYLRESLSDSNARSLLLNDCLTEVARGVGENWEDYRVIGATRSGLAPAKASVGKSPERYKLVDKGTIFYNPMRILIGSIGMVDEDDEPGITSPDYVVFKTQSGIVHPRWFYYWFRSSFGAAFIKTLARGAVRERILFQRLAKAEILLPSWDTQVKVAEKLSAIAQLRQSLEEQLTAANDLPEKLLHRAFNGEI